MTDEERRELFALIRPSPAAPEGSEHWSGLRWHIHSQATMTEEEREKARLMCLLAKPVAPEKYEMGGAGMEAI